MKKQKKILIIISIIMLVIMTGIIIVNNVTYAYMADEDANTIFTGNAEIKSLYNFHFDMPDGKAYEVSLDELQTVCSKGGSVEVDNGSVISSGRYQELCDVYLDVILAKTGVYGIKRNISDSATTWARTDDAVGLVASSTIGGSAYRSDFDNIYPWSDIKSYNINPATGEITAWYGDSNFKFDGSNGEVMTYIPEFYIRRYQENGYEFIQIARNPRDGFQKVDAFSVGRYDMSYDTMAHSKSGASPKVSQTITTFRNYAKALGSGWGQLDWRYFVLQDLYLVEYADYNSQNKLGSGNTNSSAAIANGGCDSLGMQSGTVTNDAKHCVIYRGIENIFGNVWQFIDGINIKNYVAYVNYNPATYAVDTFSGNYARTSYSFSSSEGYAKQFGYDSNHPLIGFATAVGASATTYSSDYHYTASGNRILLAGGSWSSGSHAGLFFLHTDSVSSYAGGYIGSRLLRYQV